MKEYKVIGEYRGDEDEIVTLRGDDNSSETVDGVNGDGSDEFQFNMGVDEVVRIGVEVGLWEVDGTNLNVVDDEKWDEFYERTD